MVQSSGSYLVQNVLKHLLTRDLLEDQKGKQGLKEYLNHPRRIRQNLVEKEGLVIVVYVVVNATTQGSVLMRYIVFVVIDSLSFVVINLLSFVAA